MLETLRPYETRLREWLPAVQLKTDATPQPALDGRIRVKHRRAATTFVFEYKRNLAFQDVRVVIAQLKHLLTTVPGRQVCGLLLAPYIRNEQAQQLRANGIAYLDLVG